MNFLIVVQVMPVILCLAASSVKGSKAEALQIEALPFTASPIPEPETGPRSILRCDTWICGFQFYDEETGELKDFVKFCECREDFACVENPLWEKESGKTYVCVDPAKKPFWEAIPVKSHELGDL